MCSLDSTVLFCFTPTILAANIVGEFLHASPTANSKKGGSTPARVGEDFQVAVVSIQDFALSASENTRSMTTRGSSSGSAVYWNQVSPASNSVDAERDRKISEYLAAAWEVIDRIKAEKLSEYYQAEREALLERVGPEPEADVTDDTDGTTEVEASSASGAVGREIEAVDGTFVTINKEVEEILLNNFATRYMHCMCTIVLFDILILTYFTLYLCKLPVAVT